MLPGIWIDVNWWPRSWWHKLQTRHRFVQRIVAPSCQDHASYNLMEFADDAYAAYGYWMLLIWLLLILLRNEEQGFKRNGRVIAQIQAWDGRIKRGPIADVPCAAWWMTLDAWGLQGFAIATVQTIFYAYFLWIGVSHWRDAYEHLGTIISKNPLHLQVISKSSPNSKTARVLQVNLHSSIGLMGFWWGLPDPGQATCCNRLPKRINIFKKNKTSNKKDQKISKRRSKKIQNGWRLLRLEGTCGIAPSSIILSFWNVAPCLRLKSCAIRSVTSWETHWPASSLENLKMKPGKIQQLSWRAIG